MIGNNDTINLYKENLIKFSDSIDNIELSNLVDKLIKEFNWTELSQLKKEIQSIGALFNEIENVDLDKALDAGRLSLPSYYNDFSSLLQEIIQFCNISTTEETLKDIIHSMNKLSNEKQISILNENIWPFSELLPYLPELNKEVRYILVKKIAELGTYKNEEISKLVQIPEYAKILAYFTNHAEIIIELLGLQDSNIEEIFLNRLKKNSLKLESPGLFFFWGQLSPNFRKELIKTIQNIDEYYTIERFLIFHTSIDDGNFIWSFLLGSPLKESITNSLHNNPNYIELLKNKWSQFFH